MKGLIFTYFITYGGASIAVYNPFLGLLAYVCLAIVRPDSMWHWVEMPAHSSRIVAIAMLTGWALHRFGNWRLGKAKHIVLAFIGFWLWAVISAAIAPDPKEGWAFVEAIGKILIVFLVGITMIDSFRKLKQLAWVLVLSQGYVAFEMNLSYYSGYNRMFFLGFGGMDNNSIAIAMVVGAGLAFFLAMSTPVKWQRGVAALAGLLMVHSVLFSFSRGGMLALFVSGVVAFMMLPKQPKYYLVFGLVLLIVFRLSGSEVTERFNTIFSDSNERDASAESRLDLWQDSWDAMLNQPLLGVGPNHWPLIASRYGWPKGKEAHSLWFQTGAELGFPGLIFLLLFYGVTVIRLWPYSRVVEGRADPWIPFSACMVITSIVGFAVAAQFVSLEGLEIPYYIVLLGTATLKLLPIKSPSENLIEPVSPLRGAPL